MKPVSRRDFLRSIGRCAAAGAVGWAGVRLLTQSGGSINDACRNCERTGRCDRKGASVCPLAKPSAENGGASNDDE